MPTNLTENYLRLHLLNNEAVLVLRTTFEKIVEKTSNGDVDLFLKEYEQDIKTLHNLNYAQRKILFPDNGRTNIQEWDVSLLSFILLNCCTLEGKICISKLRDLIKKQASAFKDIDDFLAYHKTTIDKMRDENILDQEQYNALFPKDLSKSILNKWDLNLLLCLLGKLCSGKTNELLDELLRQCVGRDVRLHCSSTNLAEYLKLKKQKCKNMLQDGTILRQEYSQLFPKTGMISDVNNWDNHLVQAFVTNVCVGLSRDTRAAVSIVRQIRNGLLAHKGSAEMETGEFLETWKQLDGAIDTIMKQELPDQILSQRRNALRHGSFDLTGTIDILKEYYLKETAILDSIKEVERKIELENKQKQVEKKAMQHDLNNLKRENKDIAEQISHLVEMHENIYTDTIEAECIDVKIYVSTTNHESREKTERVIRLALQNALKGKPSEIKVKTVPRLLAGVAKCGAEVVEVKTGSIVLTVQCYSLKGITNVLIHMASRKLTNNIKEIAEELSEYTREDIVLECGLPDASMETIRKFLNRLEKEYKSKLPFVYRETNLGQNDSFSIQDSDDISSVIPEDETSPEAQIKTLQAEMTASTTLKVPQVKKIQTFSIKCPGDNDDCEISSSTFLPSGEFVLCDRENESVKLFDKQYKYRCVLKLPGYPYDSCLSGEEDTEVFVTVPGKKSVYRIKVAGYIRKMGEIHVGNECWGITSCMLGIAVIVDDYRHHGYIKLLQHDGTPIRHLDFPSSDYNELLEYTYITSIIDGRQLVISNYRLSRLTSIDVANGETVFEYEDGDLKSPLCMTSDRQSNIYLIDVQSSNIHMLTSTGKKVGDIGTGDNLVAPSGLAYNCYADTLILKPDVHKNEMYEYKIIT